MTADRIRSILAWHVHGSWMESFVGGGHRYLIPVNVDKDADGRGLCGRNWPAAQEVPLDRLRDEDIDLVVLQRPHEIELVERFSGRRPGVDVPAVYVEHNAPRPNAVDSVHPLAERRDIPLVHVTDYNRLMWDNGVAPTHVIAHGIADPGNLFSGEIGAAATMINEPMRRWRTVGTDLLADLSTSVPIDVWGIGTDDLNREGRLGAVTGRGDVGHPRVLHEIAQRRVYLHTARWTSLGLSLLEAMFLGMPIVAVASTEAPMAVPAEAGVVSADVKQLASALQTYVVDLSAAMVAGKAAREHALAHFGLDRFLRDWDRLIAEWCR
ncbi:glycosyltransferase [Mycolicibacterium goodii]|uniref:Glycosyltransferase family 1 protein n=1 Tax=Mycolicibacterium goodii TaxID=134601 RepID=A0ABS6HH67_MYCGD|nr:glycosyltransferase [Mycolicibacterium goodii]MBU8810017.1 glycosyltransferase family 1 protein [Mycolicibacterium goodii]MBU8818883.1 glycosyltransferase family 1 protein [Mycolicibacterium goodii]MBU8822027.1 glycosyltransferase family 1 protein [Mycolicibacterium goodii]MBU8838807.1 glycosyltransferase family 1 protein [Mycolicibacterium goodii]PJK22685.1 glycosyl transferase [Mycolicibacterium goodii]